MPELARCLAEDTAIRNVLVELEGAPGLAPQDLATVRALASWISEILGVSCLQAQAGARQQDGSVYLIPPDTVAIPQERPGRGRECRDDNKSARSRRTRTARGRDYPMAPDRAPATPAGRS